jgi:hypothetical protein
MPFLLEHIGHRTRLCVTLLAECFFAWHFFHGPSYLCIGFRFSFHRIAYEDMPHCAILIFVASLYSFSAPCRVHVVATAIAFVW